MLVWISDIGARNAVVLGRDESVGGTAAGARFLREKLVQGRGGRFLKTSESRVALVTISSRAVWFSIRMAIWESSSNTGKGRLNREVI